MHPQTLHAFRLYQSMNKERIRPFSAEDAAECATFEDERSLASGYVKKRRLYLEEARSARRAMASPHKVCESHPMALANAQRELAAARQYRSAVLSALSS